MPLAATRAVSLVALLMLLLGTAGTAHADDVYVRVLSQTAPIRSGPGAAFRTVRTLERGTVLPVRERGTKGYWYLVDLEDGTRGWIFGEQVSTFDVVDDPNPGFFTRIGRGISDALFAPSPLPYANVTMSFSAGILNGEGVFLFRPSIIFDPYLALEVFAGQSPARQEDLYLVGAGFTFRLSPGRAFGPYIHAGAGAARREPKADAFITDAVTEMTVEVGAGFELTFKKGITLRGDFRQWIFFDENRASDAQEFSGGLAIFF